MSMKRQKNVADDSRMTAENHSRDSDPYIAAVRQQLHVRKSRRLTGFQRCFGGVFTMRTLASSPRVIVAVAALCLVAVICVSALPVEIAFVKNIGGDKTAQRLYFLNSANISKVISRPAPGLQSYSPLVNTFAPAAGVIKMASYDGDTTIGICLSKNCTSGNSLPVVRYGGLLVAAATSGALPNLPEAFFIIGKHGQTGIFGSLHLFKEVPATGVTYDFPEADWECAAGWVFCDDCTATFDPLRNWIWLIAQPSRDPEPRANQRLIVLDLNWLDVFVPFPQYKVLGSSSTSEFLYSNTTVVPGWLFVSDGALIQSVDLKTGRPNTPAELFPPCNERRDAPGVVDWRPVSFNGMICGTLWSVDDCTAERPNSLRAALLCDSGLIIPSGLPIPIDEGMYPVAASAPQE